MSQPKSTKSAQPPLVDSLLQVGKLAFDPERAVDERSQAEAEFQQLIASTSTLSLLPALNLLVQPDRVQPWLRAPLIQTLARLPLRQRGVQDTIEFVFSIHPSTASTKESVGSRASNISHEAMSAASRLLSSPPQGMSPEEWFNGISFQLFDLLDGKGEKEMAKAASYIIGFGVLGRRTYGAPGSSGWKAFVEPILGAINPSLVPRTMKRKPGDDDIVEVGMPDILVSSDALAQALRRLLTLVTSHPHPSLTKRLLNPILLPLWSLSIYDVDHAGAEIYGCSRNLLRILLQLSSSTPNTTESPIFRILENIMFRGRSGLDKTSWSYEVSRTGNGIQIEKRSYKSDAGQNIDFAQISNAVQSFVALLGDIPEFDTQISDLFLYLCRKWFSQGSTTSPPSILTQSRPEFDGGDAQNKLIEAQLLQEMINTMPEKLVQNSKQCLELVNGVLSNQSLEGDDWQNQEDIIAIALSLLNLVLTSPNFKPHPTTEPLLENIESYLISISKMIGSDIAQTAKNLSTILQFRNAIHLADDTPTSTVPSRTLEDRKTYSLAMSYLTATDSPPPVRVQGLDLLQTLITSKSPILDIPALLVLFSSLLQDNEEYVYLRSIRCFIDLASKHPRAVLADLIERYADGNEDYELDARLRLGETLVQVIQSIPTQFTGPIARSVSEGLLSIAGRRGYRPKTERDQARKQKLQDKKNKEAEDAWDGEVPQLDEVLEPDALHPEYDLLAQIISGWESKRGTEDIRIRASALTILGSAIECNVAGIGVQPISMAIDLSIHILTLEPEVEKGILRRAAILLIMSFVRALDEARSQGRKLGFGFVGQSLEDVQRILGYVEGSDNDGLVRQHARDVIEGMGAWQMNSLLPGSRGGIEDLGGVPELAGLNINPGNGQRGMKPRIEEIE